MSFNKHHYILRLSICITFSIFWALSTCVLFISVMQSVNGVQFLNINFLLVLFSTAPATVVFETVIVPLTSMYASL